MAISLNDFWKLTINGSLFRPDEVMQLADEFAKAMPGVTDPQQASQWLITGAKISPYQAKILLAGRPGPFVYGDYRIYDRIESGRLAGIFRAIHIETKHPVCLYFLSGAAMKDPQVLARLKQQAAMTYRVTVGHPNLLKCYHLAEEGPFKFLVIDDLQGKRVERLLAVKGALSVAESCRIVRQAAFGLARLHAMGQAHGDVRPANIWIAKRNVKLLLFPVYRDPLKEYTPLSEVDPKGKIPPEADYFAPELIAGDRAPDSRSDIYSLGCTLYHMLANQAPFAGGDLQQKLERHASEKPRPLDQLNLGIPTPLAKVVNYMMAKDPEMRYQQANSVVEALLPHLSPEDAQSKPDKITRHGRAYEAWLQQKLGSAAAVPAPAAAAPAVAAAVEPPEELEAEPTQMAEAAAVVAPAAPAMAAPVMAAAAAPAAPVMAAPPAPVMAAPVQAMSNGGYAPAMAAPVMAAPVMAGPVMSAPAMFPNAAPQFANAAPQFPNMGPQFPNAAPIFPNAAPQFANAAPAFPNAAPQFANAAPAFPNAGPAFPNAAPAFANGAPSFPNAGPVFPNAEPMYSNGAAEAAPSFAAAEPVVGEAGASAPLRRRKKSPVVPIVVVSVVVLALGGGGYYAMTSQTSPIPATAEHKPETKPEVKPVTPAVVTPAAPVTPPPPPVVETGVAFWPLGESMWQSPTKGKPIEAKWLAPGAQAIIALRPADIMKHPEAEKLVDAKILGALADWFSTTLPKLGATRIDNIEQVVVALLDGAGGAPKVACVIRLAEAVPEEELIAAWGNPATEMSGETKFFQANDTGYYIPKAGEGKIVAIAPLVEMRDLVATDGEPALRLEMEVLLKASDASRHFTLVYAPSFLLTGGKDLVKAPWSKLKDGLDWLLMGVDSAPAGGGAPPPMDIEPPKAVMLSGHLGDASFVELRVFNAESDEHSHGPAQMLQQRVHQLYKRVKQYEYDLDKSEYSKKVLFEFPERVKALADFTRVGMADKQVLMQTVLPPLGLQHVVLGTYLCVVENPRAAGGGAAVAVAQAGGAAKPATAAEKLLKKTSLSFPRNTLEVSMQLLAEDLQIPITIRGGDLQLEGITKNQSFGLDQRDKSAAEILQVIMKQANPDGKLVYIIKPKEGGGEEIFITTRAAVAKNGEKLPPELELKDEKKK